MWMQEKELVYHANFTICFVNWNLEQKEHYYFTQMDYASIPIPLVVTKYSTYAAMLIINSNHGNAIIGA